MDIKGKTAFVAGGTSGLGLAVARELSARGANLVIVGRRGALADQIAAGSGRPSAWAPTSLAARRYLPVSAPPSSGSGASTST